MHNFVGFVPIFIKMWNNLNYSPAVQGNTNNYC